MTPQEIKTLIQNHSKDTTSQSYSMIKRTLVNETSTFFKNVESTTKKKKDSRKVR